MAQKISEYLKRPYRVVHNNGTVVAGFDDMSSAEADAKARNAKVSDFHLDCKYTAILNPDK